MYVCMYVCARIHMRITLHCKYAGMTSGEKQVDEREATFAGSQDERRLLVLVLPVYISS